MKRTFSDRWKDLKDDCPHSIHADPHAWVKWMRDEGQGRREHKHLLNASIVNDLAAIAEIYPKTA